MRNLELVSKQLGFKVQDEGFNSNECQVQTEEGWKTWPKTLIHCLLDRAHGIYHPLKYYTREDLV
jgi:hypothetical protein